MHFLHKLFLFELKDECCSYVCFIMQSEEREKETSEKP